MMTLRNLFPVAVAVMLMLSCSVKEVRDGCPCRLVADLSEASETDGEVTLSAECNDVVIRTERTSPEGDHLHRMDVPRGDIRVTCLQGTATGSTDGRNVIIPYGHGADRLMSGTETVDCNGEMAFCKILFHKDWCEMTLQCSYADAGTYPYRIEVTGKINGFDAGTRTPLAGEFRCTAEEKHDATGALYAYLPRQDSSGGGLRMTLYSKASGEAAKEYDLTEILSECRFDWEAYNLDDIRIGIDYSGLLTDITVIDWTTGLEITVTI